MAAPFLIKSDGTPFETEELQALRKVLDSLDDNGRSNYRDQNSAAIAQHDAARFLVVSGPGTGKSHLFLHRIDYWSEKNQEARVLVTSFVRKLVADLQSDIDKTLSAERKRRITVLTLHKFARSIVEKNHGTKKCPFKPHFRIIGQSWKEIVWGDVLAFSPNIDRDAYTWEKFEQQLHNAALAEGEAWSVLHQFYSKLCQFYNAVGFADLILRARSALKENPDLSENDHFIIDEYQDFNLAEDALINQLVADAKGVIIVGDDEQTLYEQLKSGKPTLIRNLYKDTRYANGMLPFCGRSSYHITKSADYFIRQCREKLCIEKIYLPLKSSSDGPKVQIIACATSPTAVDYIEQFVADHKAEIEERRRQLEAREAKDAFLLILTPAREVHFYGSAKNTLKTIALEYQPEDRSFSESYYELLSYYSLANNPLNNFTFRKVLHYQRISPGRVHELVVASMEIGKDLYELDEPEIQDALSKCNDVRAILDSEDPTMEKLGRISDLIPTIDKIRLQTEIERGDITQEKIAQLEHEEEEEAELEQIEVKRMGAVELMTIVGSKGLSADHVIILGFDNVNMSWITTNAFYVAITRARKSLHILTALKSGGARQAHAFLDQLPDDQVEFCTYKKTNHSKRGLRGKDDFKGYLRSLASVSGPKRESGL